MARFIGWYKGITQGIGLEYLFRERVNSLSQRAEPDILRVMNGSLCGWSAGGIACCRINGYMCWSLPIKGIGPCLAVGYRILEGKAFQDLPVPGGYRTIFRFSRQPPQAVDGRQLP